MSKNIKKIKLGDVSYNITDAGAARVDHTHEWNPIIKVDSLADTPENELGLYRYNVENVSSNIVEVISEFHEGGANNIFAKTTTANNNSIASVDVFKSHFDATLSNFVTIDSLSDSVYTYNNNYPMNGIRLGTKSATGTITATLLQAGSLTFHRYFGFNGSTNTITSYDASASVVIDGTTYNFTADDEDLVIPVSTGTHIIENINGRILFLSFVFGGEAYYTYEKKHIARQEDLEAKVEELKTADTGLETKIKTVEKATQINSSAIESINAKLGSVQIFDVTKLPKASMSHINSLYRCQGILNQCIQLGDGEHKDFVFNLSGTSEVADFTVIYSDIAKDFKDYVELSAATKVFRNNGNLKLGSSKATGHMDVDFIYSKPLFNLQLGVKAYNKDGSIFDISVNTIEGSSFTISIPLTDFEKETLLDISKYLKAEGYEGETICTLGIATAESYVSEGSDGEEKTTYADPRGCVTRLIADFGEVTYEWNAIGVTEKVEPQIKVTYDELKALRDNAQLIPGQQYRIIDYVTAATNTARADICSAGHQFDIIVTADSNTVLNENARATWPEAKDEWLPGIAAEDVHILYKICDGEAAGYGNPIEETGVVGALTTVINSAGQTVPAFIDPNPDGKSGYQSSLVSIKYTLAEDNEILYEGPGENRSSDVFVELGYWGGIPALYKTDPMNGDVPGLENPDYTDVFAYRGDFELDGVNYNLWDKISDDEHVYQVLTDVVVVDNKFIITQEDLTNSIKWQYQPSPGDITYVYAGSCVLDGVEYDQWFETYIDPDNGRFGRLTNKVVKNSSRYFDKANLAAWEIKYCLDNDTTRFTWAVDSGNNYLYGVSSAFSNSGEPLMRCPTFDYPNFENSDKYPDATDYIYAWGTQADIDDSDNANFVYSKSLVVDVTDLVFVAGLMDAYKTGAYTRGKGVIYYMKDEWNNEAPYDFKNLRFKRLLTTRGHWVRTELENEDDDRIEDYFYTFSVLNRDTSGIIQHQLYDHTIEGWQLITNDEGTLSSICKNNCVKGFNNVCITEPYEFSSGDTSAHLTNNIFDLGSNGNTLVSMAGSVTDNYIGTDAESNYICNESYNNTIGANSFGNILQQCTYVKLGDVCSNIIFKDSWHNHITFGNNCSNIIVEDSCVYTIFGVWCRHITLLNRTQGCSFSNGISFIELKATTTDESYPRLYNVTIGKGINGTAINPKVIQLEPSDFTEKIIRSAGVKEIILDEGE